MSHLHLSPERLEAYVMGLASHAEELAVEREAAQCTECARALQGEARVELALPQLARGLRHRRWQRRTVRLGAAAVALAASVLVVLAMRGRTPPPSGVDVASEPLARIESEADATERARLIQEALHSGLAVQVGGELLVPHYEDADDGEGPPVEELP